MRLSISNIAWDAEEDEVVAALLQKYSVDAIDIAPGKYFSQPASATNAEIAAVKQAWTGRGVEIVGMQALLFGTTGLNLFGSPESQQAMLQHLEAVCRIGAGLGATRLVFGSPKNRDRSGLSDPQTMEIALPFFHRLGEIALNHGVTLCLEPNPLCYGANFMTSSAETAAVVRAVNHPAIRMQLDTGALAINGETATAVLQQSASLIGHIHASEPELLPLGDGDADHGEAAAAIQKHLPNHVVAIEMVATKNEPHVSAIERALKVAIHHYRDSQ